MQKHAKVQRDCAQARPDTPFRWPGYLVAMTLPTQPPTTHDTGQRPTDYRPTAPIATAMAAGDLAGRPLYLLRQSRMSTDLGTRHHYAFTHPRADLIYREYIANWLGRGPCAVVNDLAIVEDYEPQDQEYVTVCKVLHELAHIIDRPVIHERASDSVCAERVVFDGLVLAEVSKRPLRSDLPLYFGHELSFIRAVLHLAYRATAAAHGRNDQFQEFESSENLRKIYYYDDYYYGLSYTGSHS
jgi:hypothetical protein